MEELQKSLENLKVRPDEGAVMTSLETILTLLEDEALDRDTSVISLVDGNILKELHFQLQSQKSSKEKVAQVVAELAKTEEARGPCVTEGLVPGLLELVAGADTAPCVQACRALGNICFDNDAARRCIDEREGVALLLNLLRAQLDATTPEAAQLRKVACGFLLNLTNTHETVQEKVLSQGGLEILNGYLMKHSGDESVVQMALLSIGCLTDSDTGRQKLREVPIAVTIGGLLGTPVGVELQDSVLELLATLAECDEVKVQLAHSPLCDRLLDLMQSARGSASRHEEDAQLEKLGADLLILLLTGDASMNVLYGDGSGRVYKECLDWLQTSNDYLRMSGALAVGNFARNDAQCIKLVENGITERLLALLEGATADDAYSPIFTTRQHAVFSALRNLAIPAANKPAMLQCGLISRVLQHIHTEFSVVQFKMLGMLRMVIDGQESGATELGTSDVFLPRLVTWCTVEEHAGVKGEANRLVAWLIRHSRSTSVMTAIIKHGGLPHLVAMVPAEHTVMQNEALVALAMIASAVLDCHKDELIKADIVPTLKTLLTEGATAPEVTSNALSLIKALSKSDELKKQMISAELPAIVRKLQNNDDSKISQPAKEVTSLFGKG